MRSNHVSAVMPIPGFDPGIVAGIHVFLTERQGGDVDGRDEPGHDCREMVQYDPDVL